MEIQCIRTLLCLIGTALQQWRLQIQAMGLILTSDEERLALDLFPKVH